MDAALAGDLGQSSVAWRIHSDRLVALVERLRYAEAVAEYETLITAGRPLPAYAHTAAGEAYIALERPEDALTALTTAVSLAPDDMDARTSLFFAYSELEHVNEATVLADKMVARFPQLERVPGSRVAKPNTNRLQAELLAALNHPHIAQIHGLAEAAPAGGDVEGGARGATRALVMELVEGPTLADRIAQGAVPVTEALPLAGQLAEALEYGHGRQHPARHDALDPQEQDSRPVEELIRER